MFPPRCESGAPHQRQGATAGLVDQCDCQTCAPVYAGIVAARAKCAIGVVQAEETFNKEMPGAVGADVPLLDIGGAVGGRPV